MCNKGRSGLIKTLRHLKTFFLDMLTAIRDLTTAGRELKVAIDRYNDRVSEFHTDVRKIEHSVGFLYRAERWRSERAQDELLKSTPLEVLAVVFFRAAITPFCRWTPNQLGVTLRCEIGSRKDGARGPRE
jgi:hypothetical protein